MNYAPPSTPTAMAFRSHTGARALALIVFAIFAVLAFVSAAVFVGAFCVMLLLGALHTYYPIVPAAGFYPSLLLYVLTRILFGGYDFRLTQKDK